MCRQSKLRDMERQVEWLKAERDEGAAASQGAAADLAARLKDSDQALARLKVRHPPLLLPGGAGGARSN